MMVGQFKKCKDSEYLSIFIYLSNILNSKRFIKEINQLVLSFIYACANIRIENQKNKNFAYAVAIAIKKINHLRDLNIILAQYL